ncbi:MAG: hypothetical protein WD314_14890 [Trueperaceae bacterium]
MLPYTRAAVSRRSVGKLNAIETEPTNLDSPDLSRWWGQTGFADDQVRRWNIGPSAVWVERREFEWRLHRLERPAGDDTEIEAATICNADEIDPDATLDRFAVGSNGMNLTVSALLADRPVVVRPETPLYVPSGEDVTLYVSTPIWLRFEVAPPNRLLAERPALRPSDTWFGPSTLVGELCYASRTSGRLKLAELPRRPHRAITPMRIRNLAKDALLLQRVKVPVQYLTLYHSPSGGLWTQMATALREQDGDLAALQLGRRAPAEAAGAKQIAAPRQQAESHLALRAFTRLFGSA